MTTPLDPELVAAAQDLAAGLLERLGWRGTVRVEPGPEGPWVLIEDLSPEPGPLIGREGETLNALERILNLLVQRRLGRWPALTVDVVGYRRRRREALEGLARRMAEQVRLRRRPIALPPMPAAERRIVHLALAENPFVTTRSEGEGDDRHVVIEPR